MSLVYLIRHGQTDWNRERRFQGHRDIGLNAEGHSEARRLAGRLAGERIAACYSSDLARARATALPSAEVLGLEVVERACLRERDYGIFEGLTIPEIVLRHPLEYARWTTHDPTYAIPDGESQEGFRDRIFACVDALVTAHRPLPILVVTHGGALDMLYRRAQGLPWDQPRSCPVPNAAVNLLDITEGQVRILSWADDGQLSEDKEN